MIKKRSTLLISFILLTIVLAISYVTKIPVLQGISFWLIFLYLLILSLPKSILQQTTMGELKRKDHIIIAVACFLTIAICVLPMDLSPFWNGRIPMHRNQYELMADAILNGHIYFDYEVDPRLLEMEDPYDFMAKMSQGIEFHLDHAFYEGHYYMYFGVVPVFLLFIPFKLITGRSLVTFHATQFFSAVSILAFFVLFYLLARKYFKKLPLGTYILAASSISMIALGYCTQAPALYCTAICSGICMELLSILAYVYAVLFEKKEWRKVLFAVLGALFGALAFGCRPPVALANLVAIPLAVLYAKQYDKGKLRLARNFFIIAIPYVIIAALLMSYNYARFDSPFEFGQAYQLTTSDQTVYTNFADRFNWVDELNFTFNNFFILGPFTKEFPFINYGGLLVTYPMMWILIPLLSNEKVRKTLKQYKLFPFALFLLGTSIFITLMDVYWAPGLCERYRLDEYFLLGILSFLLMGAHQEVTVKKKQFFSTLYSVFAIISILMTFLLFMRPCDANFAETFPEKAAEIANILLFRF